MGALLGFGKSDQKKANASMDQALAALAGIGIPTVEAQRIILEQPELVGQLIPELEGFAEQLGDSAMKDVEAPGALKTAQMDALNSFISQAEAGGMTPQDEAELNNIMREAAGVGQSRDSGIMQNMAERGMGGGGMELATRLKSSQDAMQNAAVQGQQRAAMAFEAKQNALTNIANLSGSMRTQDVGEQTNKAQAADLINQFNLNQRAGVKGRDVERKNVAQAANLANKQEVSNAATNTRNMQEQYNKELYQQNFQNQVQKAGGVAGALQARSQNYLSQAQAKQAGFDKVVAGGMKMATPGPKGGCLGPGSPIQMADGSLKEIEKIKVGDEVALGGRVLGTSDHEVDPSEIYNYMGVIATKDHMVQEDGVFKRVEFAEYAIPFRSNISMVYNITTENQRIVCNDIIFGDEEMIKEYELSKNFQEQK